MILWIINIIATMFTWAKPAMLLVTLVSHRVTCATIKRGFIMRPKEKPRL